MALSKEKEQEYIERVRMDGNELQSIDEQTEEVCLEGVKKNGRVLEMIENKTCDICLEAVKQNGLALTYVDKQTNEICFDAMRRNGFALRYAKEKSHKLSLEAVKQNGYALDCVVNQTEEIKLMSLFDDFRSCDLDELNDFYKAIDNPTKEMNLIYQLLEGYQDYHLPSYQETRLKLTLKEMDWDASPYLVLDQLYMMG